MENGEITDHLSLMGAFIILLGFIEILSNLCGINVWLDKCRYVCCYGDRQSVAMGRTPRLGWLLRVFNDKQYNVQLRGSLLLGVD